MELIARIGWPSRMEFIARIGWPRRRKCTRVLVCLRDSRWSLVLVRVGHLLIDFCCSPECPCLPEYSTATRIPSILRIPEYLLFPEYPNGQTTIVTRIETNYPNTLARMLTRLTSTSQCSMDICQHMSVHVYVLTNP